MSKKTMPFALLNFALGLGVLFSVLDSQSAQAAGEVYLALGSDVALWNYPSNSPTTIDVYQFSSYYKPDIFIASNSVGYQVMSAAFRNRCIDSFGQPLKMTWWIMGGNVFRYAANLNVPLNNTMNLYLMKKYHGDAIRAFGDELTLHYHTFAWNDPNGDGIYHWNQTATFLECKDDFDLTLAQYLLEENVFPVSFRSGWHFMDNDWQACLDQLLPFSLHNDYPKNVLWSANPEPIAGAENWLNAPSAFVPFHPSTTNYQVPGDGTGWELRSVKIQNLTSNMVDQLFAAAEQGTNQAACFWTHPAEDIINQVIKADAFAHAAATNHPAVSFRYCTATEAMQRWQGLTNQTPPALAVSQSGVGTNVTLTLQTSVPIWQPQPFVALKDVWGQYQILSCTGTDNVWGVSLSLSTNRIAKVGIAITDLNGNLTTRILRYVPDDLFIDNLDPQYVELEGNWSNSAAASWGTDCRVAVVRSNEVARAQWQLPISSTGQYALSVQVPKVTNAASQLTFTVFGDGVPVISTTLTSAIPSFQWTLVATAFLDQARSNVFEMTVAGANQPGSFAVADVLKIAFMPDTNRAPSAFPFGAATAENTPLRLHIMDILRNASDPDDDPLTFSAASSSTNGGQVTLTATNVLYAPPANYTGADAFGYAVNDGHGASASSTVEILVLAGAVPGPDQIVLVPQTNSWELRFAGNPGAPSEVQRSTDLLSWQTLWSGALPIYGMLQYADTNAPSISAFYRVVATGP